MTKKVEGVAAVQRALSILLCFEERDGALGLAELARRTQLDKATALRLARTLAAAHFLARTDDGSWRLGPALMRLGNQYQSTFSLREVAEPLLARLSASTGESAALYIRENDKRVCLFRHDSAQSIRHHIHVGTLLPLDRGAPGRLILAFSGAEGAPYDEIREKGFYATFGERDPQVASVAVPVFGSDNKLFGSLAVTGPPNRFDIDAVKRHLEALRAAGHQLTLTLGGVDKFFDGSSDANESPVDDLEE